MPATCGSAVRWVSRTYCSRQPAARTASARFCAAEARPDPACRTARRACAWRHRPRSARVAGARTPVTPAASATASSRPSSTSSSAGFSRSSSLARSSARVELGDAEATRWKAPARPGRSALGAALAHGGDEIVAARVQQRLVGERARRDDAHHLALHRTPGGPGVADLLADGHRLALAHESRQVVLRGVVGHAGHGDRLAAGLPAGGQRDVEQAARRAARLRRTARRNPPCGRTAAGPGNSALMRRYCCITGVWPASASGGGWGTGWFMRLGAKPGAGAMGGYLGKGSKPPVAGRGLRRSYSVLVRAGQVAACAAPAVCWSGLGWSRLAPLLQCLMPRGLALVGAAQAATTPTSPCRCRPNRAPD